MKKIIRFVSVYLILATLVTLGVSFFTDYKEQKAMAETGIVVRSDWQNEGIKGSRIGTTDGSKLIPVKGEYDAYYFKKGSRVEVHASLKDGYSFDGWYINNKKVSSSQTYIHTVTESVTLEARAKINSYTVTVDFDGGEYNGKTSWSTTYTTNDRVGLPVPDKIGNIFLGYTDLDTGDELKADYIIERGSSGDRHFTVRYRPTELHIQYNVNGGILKDTGAGFKSNDEGFVLNSNGAIFTHNYKYTDKTLVATGFADWNNKTRINIHKDYYTGLESSEWYADIDGERKYFNQKTVYNLSDIADIDWEDKTITVYVNWRPNKLSVNHYSGGGTRWLRPYFVNVDGGQVAIEPDACFYTQEFNYGEKIPEYGIYDASRLGYDYHSLVNNNMYLKDKSGNLTTEISTDNNAYASPEELAEVAGCIEEFKNGDTSFDIYPKWRKNRVTIQYNANGGTLNKDLSGSEFTQDSQGFILKNGSRNVQVADYDDYIMNKGNGFYDYNNGETGKYINITKYGYIGVNGKEWNTKPDGSGVSFDQTKEYFGRDVADLVSGDVTLVVYVNWLQEYMLDINVVLDGVTEAYGESGLFTCDMYKDGVKVYDDTYDKVIHSDKPFTYEIKDIKYKKSDTYKHIGFSDNSAPLSGEVNNRGCKQVNFKFVTIYTDTIHHVFGGFNRDDLYNKDVRYDILSWEPVAITHKFGYQENIVLGKDLMIEIPNGYHFNNSVVYSESGKSVTHKLNDTISQEKRNMEIDYMYVPYDYNITYNLDGGTNSPDNPSIYNVVHGVTLKEPTKEGYTFDGWYTSDGKKVTGINEGATGKIKDANDMYAQLASRQTGDITLTAKWRVSESDLCDSYKFYKTVCDYIMQNDYVYSIYMGVQPPSSSYSVSTFDVSVNGDGSILADIVRDNYMHYSIYVYHKTGGIIVTPSNMDDYFSLSIPTIRNRVEHISMSNLEYRNTSTVKGLFRGDRLASVTLNGKNNNLSTQGMFKDCNHSGLCITIKNGFAVSSTDLGLTGVFYNTSTGKSYNGYIPSEDGVYYRDNKAVIMDTGRNVNTKLYDLVRNNSIRNIIFTSPETSPSGFSKVDISEKGDGSVVAYTNYDGGSQTWMNIYICATKSDTSKLYLNNDSIGLFDGFGNNNKITVDFGQGVLNTFSNCQLRWHTYSDISYTGDDICGLVSSPNNRSSAISENSKDSDILDITDTLVPEIENSNIESVTDDSIEETSDSIENNENLTNNIQITEEVDAEKAPPTSETENSEGGIVDEE